MPRSRPWIIAAALVFSLALGWFATRRLAASRLRSGLDEVRGQMDSGRHALARRTLLELAGQYQGDAELNYQLGSCEHALGRDQEALAAWSRIPADSPWAGRAAFEAGRVAFRAGRLAEAESRLRDALRLGGADLAETRRQLIQVLRFEGRSDSIRRLNESTPFRSADDVREAWSLEFDPYPQEAVAAYLNDAARRWPDDPGVQIGLANLAIRAGRLDDAARHVEIALRLRPDETAWRARLDLAVASGRTDDARDALAHLDPATLAPADLRRLDAWFARRAGDFVRERQALEQMLAAGDDVGLVLGRLVELAIAAGDAEQARGLQARKAEFDRAGERYRGLLDGERSASHADELARLARTLGRPADVRCWDRLAGRASKPFERPSAPILTGSAAHASLRPEPRPPGLATTSEALIVPTFVETAEADGLRFRFECGRSPARQLPETMSGGVGLLDFDGDGHLDVYAVQGGAFPPADATNRDRLFRNRGDGTFDDATESAGLPHLRGGYGHGIAVGDVDNDGDPDVLVTRWRAYNLYLNRGDGTFADATGPWGLGGDRDWPTSAAFADLDEDGDLDLYVCHYLAWDPANPRPCVDEATGEHFYCNPRDLPALPDHLFRNDGDHFVDISTEAGIVDADGRGLGVLAVDVDDDGRVDLFVANDTTADYLWHNLGGGKFEEIGHAAGVAANANGRYMAGMGVACGDVDGDGRPDLVETNFYDESTRLYHNLGRDLFVDHTAPSGLEAPSRNRLGFGVVLADFNNDGWSDVATANGHVNDGMPRFPYRMQPQLFLGRAGEHFRDLTGQSGPALGAEYLGRGLAAGDLDHDGRVDLVLVDQDAALRLLRNRTEAAGHWIGLELEGRQSNRDGVGARVIVRAGDREWSTWRVGGGSYQSAGSPWLSVGIGGADRVDSVEVRWPSGRRDRFEGLAAGARYRLIEGEPVARPRPVGP